jgi:two-component system chemotaxis response regulator CheB
MRSVQERQAVRRRTRASTLGRQDEAADGAVSAPSKLERLSAEFGRSSAKREHAVAADLGCPACRGVLYVSELGKHGWLSFRCRIGHGFSADSLLSAKEEQLEQALWSSVEVLDELIQFYAVLVAGEREGTNPTNRAALRGRLAAARRHRRVLYHLIPDEGPAPGADGRKRGTHARE